MPEKRLLIKILLVTFGLLIFLWLLFFVTPLKYSIMNHRSKDVRNHLLRGVAWFDFNHKPNLSGWEEKIFQGRVLYSIKSGRTGKYLNAYSKNAASGMIYWLKFNPCKNPMVSWKWKVVKFPDKNISSQKENWWIEKDDYAARFYIIFPRFPFFRLQCLEYIWDQTRPAGTVLTNPNFRNLKIIVAESGDKNLGQWITVERNVCEDFNKVFGRAPGNVGAIAIMTDSDNSGSVAEAQYNDIEVGYGNQ